MGVFIVYAIYTKHILLINRKYQLFVLNINEFKVNKKDDIVSDLVIVHPIKMNKTFIENFNKNMEVGRKKHIKKIQEKYKKNKFINGWDFYCILNIITLVPSKIKKYCILNIYAVNLDFIIYIDNISVNINEYHKLVRL